MNMQKKNQGLSQEWWCIDLGHAVAYPAEELARLSEACFRFTPDVVVAQNRIFLEMSRTKKHFTLDTVQKRVQILAERISFKLGQSVFRWRWGIGKTIPQAWVQTKWKSTSPHLLPIDSIFDFMNPLRATELNRRDRERVSLFFALGIRTIQDLFQVPPDALLTRFGSILDDFSKNFHEGERFPWVRHTPSVELLELSRWNAEDWVADSDSLIFRIKPVVDRLMGRLFSLRRSLKKLEITLKLDSRGIDRVLELQFAFPQTSSQLLLKILREKISADMQRDPLTDPVVEVSIRVLETTKREEASLRFHFSESNDPSEHDDFQEKWMELISYLGIEQGERTGVFQAETTEHLLPEKSWRKVLIAEPTISAKLDQVSHLFQKRPLRLLPEPIRLAREGMFLKRTSAQGSVFFENELWRICEFACEERLNGYEWDIEETQGFDRTYYRVKVQKEGFVPGLAVDAHGVQTEEWWVYKDEVLNKLMLHGVF